ncbi:MAG: hypothetical protein V2I45_00915 [Halieaceae bacterium]|nr:hypothetical protein [Halieaceae bacterium]
MLGLVTDSPQAGETDGNFADGSARRVAIAGNVEHVEVFEPLGIRADRPPRRGGHR